MSLFYQCEHLVDSREVDLFGQMKPSALLGMLQEAAVGATGELKMNAPRLMEKYHAFWVVSRWQTELLRPLFWEEQVTVRTWHRGSSGASLYRDFELFADGQSIGRATSLWVMTDPDSRRLVPVRDCAELRGTDGGALNRTEKIRRVALPEAFDRRAFREMHYSDTDMNGHVNNTRYADFACDAVGLETLGQGRFVSGLHLCFLSECRAGETLALDSAVLGDGCFVRGSDERGQLRFECALTLRTAPGEN